MKAILIDPKSRSVEYVETALELPNIYRLIGCEHFDTCRPFAGLQEVAFVNDRGQLMALTPFRISGYRYPLFGKTLICGFDYTGRERSTALTIEQVHDLVEFA